MPSPVSNDGRGLKHVRVIEQRHAAAPSPVSNDGRGLKRLVDGRGELPLGLRLSVMTGVD